MALSTNVAKQPVAPTVLPFAARGSRLCPSQPNFLIIEGVSIAYRTGRAVHHAVDRVSFSISAGERLVLLGPSGCGKSTLLRAIAGFITPSAGRITMDGEAVTDASPARAMVFQEFDQLLPWKTVLQNVAYPLILQGVTRTHANMRAAEILREVGLGSSLQSYPHVLSGGMKQRAAIARALVTRPRVVLMDEPFASLDAFNRRRLQEDLVALASEFELTVVFVTHSIDEALLVGTRLHLLSPHPGRSAGEFDASGFGFDSVGSASFHDASRSIEERLAVRT